MALILPTAHSAPAQRAGATPGNANLADFLPAAFDSLPQAGGRIDVPSGTHAWKTCISLEGKTLAIVGADLGSTVFSVQVLACGALAITEPDEARSVALRDFTMQPAHAPSRRTTCSSPPSAPPWRSTARRRPTRCTTSTSSIPSTACRSSWTTAKVMS